MRAAPPFPIYLFTNLFFASNK